MQRSNWKIWAAAVLTAGSFELPFPLAGPLPAWRTVFAWFGLVPLLVALLKVAQGDEARPLWKSFLLGYLSGMLWYAGNCYWIYDTMRIHGNVPPVASVLMLVGFSLVLGAYWGLFSWGVQMVRRQTGSARIALAIAPALWAALELVASRVTSVPWDQLGYSQVDNALVNQLAPWTGVYGISFVLVAVNALIAGGVVLSRTEGRRRWGICGATLLVVGASGMLLPSPQVQPTATAMLVQPNLDVDSQDLWGGAAWDAHIAQFSRLADPCDRVYLTGIPQTGAGSGKSECGPVDLVAWPESPAPYFEEDEQFLAAMKQVAQQKNAPMVVGGVGMTRLSENSIASYNSAIIFGADGNKVGRYDKIHLVPFGEFIPYRDVLFFAHKLTSRVGELSRGEDRKVFRLNGHKYGVFICYESVFADEVRHFSQLGAEVLVNISNDGWYGDTSAPWQHLNMARMRAIENRRWILRDTNNGVTAVIDPYGRVRQSVARHQVDALAARYGFRDDITFYTAYGDVFAWCCAILGFGVVGWALRSSLRLIIQSKVRSKE